MRLPQTVYIMLAFEVDEEDVTPLLEPAEKFITEVENLINKNS